MIVENVFTAHRQHRVVFQSFVALHSWNDSDVSTVRHDEPEVSELPSCPRVVCL